MAFAGVSGMAGVVDVLLDRTVAPGYSRLGLAARSALAGWPAGPQRLDGKVALVTGGTSGIGAATAAGLSSLGAHVVITGRDVQRTRAAAAHLGDAPGARVEGRAFDVSSLADLAAFTDAWDGPLDILVNNAAVMPARRSASADGVELTFATGVLGPWVLIERLRPHMPSGARIINVTSGGMYAQRLVPDPDAAAEPYAPARVYARSKRALMVITEQWADRLRAQGITVNAMHPGWVDTPGVTTSLPTFARLAHPILRDAAAGADTITWLAGSLDVAAETGRLWMDRRPRPTSYGPWTKERPGDRERLWDLCAHLGARIGVTS